MFVFVGLLHSAAMKFSLIAAVVVLALAQGVTLNKKYIIFVCDRAVKNWLTVFFFFCPWKPTGSFAQDASDLERLGQYFEEMKNKMTQDLTEIIRSQDLTNQAQWVTRTHHSLRRGLAMTHAQGDLNLLAADHTGPCPLLNANQQVVTSTSNLRYLYFTSAFPFYATLYFYFQSEKTCLRLSERNRWYVYKIWLSEVAEAPRSFLCNSDLIP